jgi:transposase-like protein
LLLEIEGHESDSFAQFPDYIARLKTANKENYAELSIKVDGTFEAAFFAPASMRKASKYIRHFVALDATHTKSKYRMQLLICCGLDANDEVIPLAWGLVPTENEVWWKWFCVYLRTAFPSFSDDQYVYISDRDKGIAAAVCEVFPLATASHCCQHISDNLCTMFGNKCTPLFWCIARAKTKERFQEAMKALGEHKEAAAEYINNIPHMTWARLVVL